MNGKINKRFCILRIETNITFYNGNMVKMPLKMIWQIPLLFFHDERRYFKFNMQKKNEMN